MTSDVGVSDLWLLQLSEEEPHYELYRLDAGSGRELARVEIRSPPPLPGDGAQLAAGAGAIWIAAGHVSVYRIDPARMTVAAVVDVGFHLDGLAITHDSVWVSNDRDGGRVIRIDPDDDRIDLAMPHAAHQLAFGAGSLWTTWNHRITRLDPATLGGLGTIELPGFVLEPTKFASQATAVAMASGMRTPTCEARGNHANRHPAASWRRWHRARTRCVVSGSHESHHVYERSPGAAASPLPRGYRPRRPETTACYRIIAEHVETMLEQARERSAHGFGLPRHVERSFRRYLECGVLARGFARVQCPSCRFEILVPWSCKTRGLCSSCDGRRMTDTAAHLVNRVLPSSAGYRQWTLSLPRHLRFRLLRDAKLASEVLTAFVRVVFAYHRRRARELGIARGHAGSISVPQRFGSFGNANWHAHVVIPDGVFAEADDGRMHFHRLPPPTDDDIATLAARIVRRTARILARRDAAAYDDEPPDALAHAQADAVQVPLALPIDEPEPGARSRRSLCAFVDGFSLHAATFVPPHDRA
ncbi:MAG: transposase zinc-binding domain-containing protein, partial [Deltaproteobacteria bacterium]|nr:transposase zinc-binding domain-containing protein [Deltaproteobacteria bacterium]